MHSDATAHDYGILTKFGDLHMNYNALRYFSVLAQVEHYTIAAARLGVSQPCLSNAIHNLENDLGGVKLFEKSGRNIRLTEEGRFFQEKWIQH